MNFLYLNVRNNVHIRTVDLYDGFFFFEEGREGRGIDYIELVWIDDINEDFSRLILYLDISYYTSNLSGAEIL